MVNVFGDHTSMGQPGLRGPPGRSGSKGDQGPKGDSGRSGIAEMYRWIPNLILEQFQKNETCCFLLTDSAKDLIKTADKYVTWNSRSGSKMNTIQNPSKKVFHISKIHNSLVFIKSLYGVDDVVL